MCSETVSAAGPPMAFSRFCPCLCVTVCILLSPHSNVMFCDLLAKLSSSDSRGTSGPLCYGEWRHLLNHFTHFPLSASDLRVIGIPVILHCSWCFAYLLPPESHSSGYSFVNLTWIVPSELLDFSLHLINIFNFSLNKGQKVEKIQKDQERSLSGFLVHDSISFAENGHHLSFCIWHPHVFNSHTLCRFPNMKCPLTVLFN